MGVTKIKDFDFNTISKEISFVLDTNVLYFVHSGYYLPAGKKDVAYSNFIGKISANGNPILVSSLNVQEFMNLIENQEYRLYLKSISSDAQTFTKKDFRRNTTLKSSVKRKLDSAFLQLKSTYCLVDAKVENCQIESFVSDYELHRYDPIDYIMVNNLPKNEVIYLTDDKDFQFDSEINVVTI